MGPRARSFGALVGVLIIAIQPTQAHADGAHIALHATSGGYTVTLFTAPVPLVPGLSDLRLLVQDAASGRALGDAVVSGGLAAASAATRAVTDTATGAQEGTETKAAVSFAMRSATAPGASAASPPLLTTQLRLPAPGDYGLTLRVERPGSGPAAIFHGRLEVEADHSRRTAVNVALLAPLGVVLLFLLNQQAKQTARRRRERVA